MSISRRSSSVEVWSLVRLSVLVSFREEKNRSTFPVEKGRLKSNSLISKILGHLDES